MPAAIPGRSPIQVRIDRGILRKLKKISENETRNLNSQITYFLKNAVERYEQEHGPIELEDESDGE